ncbi:hypothetical protein HHL11_17375 [Ramlibacter sp. G-1-2-2]|uniref:Uncharacterized protein n=1 Tax=Ramlibacter agri TaxID=2728837 RepID=A0A848H4W3_9BURK|nr:hypothetical protein [Ramlibacter agri]NML45527.1 hypothetical protein [Ramlibacter agri]
MRPVQRRSVFYVSGFDPKGAAHYHALYRDEAAAQERAGGLPLEVGARKRLADGNAAWSVAAEEDGAAIRTHYEFVRWDHVVRAHWPRGKLQLWRDMLVASLFNLRHGSLWRMFKQCWPPAVALFIPFVVLCVLLLGAPLLGGLAAWGAWTFTGQAWTAWPAVALVLLALAWFERRMDERFNMYWLMRSYAFTRKQALGRTPDLEAALDAQARKLAAQLRDGEDDEVLVVGHSSGAIMAALLVVRALRLLEGKPHRATLSLLTLGQCIPLLATLPQALRFRDELAELGRASDLHWVDFSAPPDASCFALCPPPGAEARTKLLSPRFAEMFDAPSYRALRRDKFRMHFQYLMAAPRPVDYDYFRITAGAKTLEQRFAHLASVTDFRTLRPFG